MSGFDRVAKGLYNPQNDQKYRGTRPIVYRSGLELSFFRWCDRNGRVLQWGSESVVIPYLSPKDGKMHKYFVDNVLILQTDNGNKKFLVEIKPEKQTTPPTQSARKSKKNLLYEQITWAVNSCKWEAANNWCKKNGFEFVILTEKDLR
jgi:hypothetical protein